MSETLIGITTTTTGRAHRTDDAVMTTIAVMTIIAAITEGITTTAAAMAKETTTHLGITPQRTGRGINFHNFQPPKEQKLATRQM